MLTSTFVTLIRVELYLRHCCILHRSIAARIGQDLMPIYSKWNRLVPEFHMECRAGSLSPFITTSRENRNLTRMALMDHTATSRALSPEIGSFAKQVSA